MASKKNKKATTYTANLPALKIGSRVRCTDDGIEGRIVWANGVSLKIEWTDGEKVTWRRDSLATRPIEILDADGEDEQPAAPAVVAEETTGEADQPTALADPIAPEPTATTEQPQPEAETTPAPAEPATTEPATSESQAPTSESAESEPTAPASEVPAEQTTPSNPDATAATAATRKRQRKTPAEPKVKKLSALDAAAKVLAEAGQAMNAQEMIQAMADKGYWTSPGGKTPAATIYAAIISEIKKKGATARFVKTERGKFARTTAV